MLRKFWTLSVATLCCTGMIPGKDILDVDWGMLHEVFETYLCSGNPEWYHNIQNGGDANPDLRMVLTFGSILVCGQEFKNHVVTLYYETFQPIIRRNTDIRQCYRDGFHLLLSRYVCCPELNSCAEILAERLHDQLGCHDNKGFNDPVTCTILSYVRRLEILNQLYAIAYATKLCSSCNRMSFRQYIKELRSANHRPRMKRVYDIFSMLRTLDYIEKLDINTMDINANKDSLSSMKKILAYKTRTMLFLGEGILHCSIKSAFLDLSSSK